MDLDPPQALVEDGAQEEAVSTNPIQDAPAELTGVDDELSQAKDEIANLKVALADAEAKNAEIELGQDEALHTASLKQAELEASLENATSAAAESGKKVQTLLEENDGLKGALEALQKTIEQDPQLDRGSVAQLESEKTELLKLVERLEADKQDLRASMEALQATQSSTVTSMRRIETTLSVSTDAERQARLRLQAAESELAIITRDRDWHKSELASLETSSRSFRQEKQAQVTQLQASLDIAQQTAESSTSSLTLLRSSHTTMEKRLMEALNENAQVKAALIESETSFKADMDAQKRLIDLLNKREAESRKKLDQVDQKFEEIQVEHEQREAELEAALEKERTKYETLQAKLQETREMMDRQAAGLMLPPSPTSQNGFNVTSNGDQSSMMAVDTPARPSSSMGFHPNLTLSPAASLATKIQKSGRSYTEIYTDYIRIQAELSSAHAEISRLTDCLNAVLLDIEDRAPMLREQRAEYQRSQQEISQLSSSLAETSEQRDMAQRQTEGYKADLEAAKRENRTLSQQLRDLGKQCRSMVRSLAAKEDRSIEERSATQQNDDYEDEMARLAAINDMTDTDAVIDAQLVTFRSVSELQANNQKLLRIVRDLGRRMEEQDEALKTRISRTENSAVQEAHQVIVQLREELQSTRTSLEAASRERDMFRRMINSTSTQTSSTTNGHSSASADGESDTRRLLTETTSNFEAYKREMTEDLRRLRSELERAHSDSRQHQIAASKGNSQITVLSERLKLISEEDQRKVRESAEHTKTIGRLQSQLAKQDDAVYHVNEKLLEMRSERDRLTNETRNLRAERDAWKSTEARLTAEYQGLSQERSSLNDLIRNLQTMQHEIERVGSESRKKAEEQNVSLQSQLDELKARHKAESETHRQLAIRREVESREAQQKLDKLTTELSTTRESLSVARTAQLHLEQRANDLAAQVTSKEEKLAIYEGRSKGTLTSADTDLSREQQLEIELAELRAQLRSTQLEATQAKLHVEQYQAISQSNEDALASLSATSDAFRTSTEEAIAAKDTELASLRDRLQSLSGDLTAASAENSSIHEEVSQQRSEYEKKLKELENVIMTLGESEAAAKADQQAARSEFSSQVALAREADEKYNRELLAHAEDARALATLREEMGSLRNRLSDLTTQASTATLNLQSSTASWETQRLTLSKELDDVKAQFAEVKEQNALLHQHLESVTAQATKIQDQSDSLTKAEDATGDELSQVVKYLRGQQEILELQLQLEKQEKSRLVIKLEHVERSLDENRAQLSEERQAAATLHIQSAQHEELLAKITELDILRESNGTLRSESSANARRATHLAAQVAQLEAQIEPLREQVASLSAEVSARDDQIKLLVEDNARWKQRNEQVLAKYERIDPAELQALKDEVSSLKDRLEATNTAKENQITEIARQKEEEAEQFRSHIQKLEEAVETGSTAETELQRTTQLLFESRNRFKNIQQISQNQRTTIQEKQKIIDEAQAQIDSLNAQLADATTKLESTSSVGADISAQNSAWESEKAELERLMIERRTNNEAELTKLNSELSELKNSLDSVKQDLEAERKKAIELETKAAQVASPVTTFDPTLVQAEVEKRLAAIALPQAADTNSDDASMQQRQEEMQALITKERERAIEELKQTLTREREEILTARLAEASSGHAKALQSLREEMTAINEQALGALSATHQASEHQLQLQLTALTTQAKDAQKKEAELRTALENLRNESSQQQTDGAKGMTEQEVAEAVAQVKAELELKHETALRAKDKEHQQQIDVNNKEHQQQISASVKESESKFSAIKNANSSNITKLKKLQTEFAALKEELAAMKAVASSTEATADETVPSPTNVATPGVGFSIKGVGKASASDLPPLPSQGGNTGKKTTPTTRTAARAVAKKTSTGPPQVRSMLKQAVSTAVESAGSPGSVGKRPRGGDDTDGEEGSAKRPKP